MWARLFVEPNLIPIAEYVWLSSNQKDTLEPNSCISIRE
jgi:hypothetical protein